MARRTKAEAEQTRNDLLDAAEALFFERGVSGTSLDDIARAAGVTRGAVYWHFKNKLDLFCAMEHRVRLPHEELLERTMSRKDAEPLDVIEEAVVASLASLFDDEQKQRVLSIMFHRCEYVGDMAEALARFEEAKSRLWVLFLDAFREASRRGQLAAAWTPEVACLTLRACMTGLLDEWMRDPLNPGECNASCACIGSLFSSFRRGSPADLPPHPLLEDVLQEAKKQNGRE